MNPEEQKRQATLRVEMGKLALATAEELSAMRQSILRQQAQVATLHRQVKTLEDRLAEETAHRITGDNLERTARLALQDRCEGDYRSLRQRIDQFIAQRVWARLRWLIAGAPSTT